MSPGPIALPRCGTSCIAPAFGPGLGCATPGPMRYLPMLLVLSMAGCAGDEDDCVGGDCVCTDAGACEIDCGDQCNAICERSDVCSSSCGDDCDLVCRDADRCDGVCGDGCFATCERPGTCVIDCG